MDSKITQVDGCAFTTEELQQFHGYYRYSFDSAGLADAPLAEKIEHYASQTPGIEPARLREWLRTMGIQDDTEEKSEEETEVERLYARFEAFDFASAPGFSDKLTQVYTCERASKHEVDQRMEQAKAQYYNEHVEPLDYEAYREHREANKPKPVCPYQHLWDTGEKDAGDGPLESSNGVWVVDLAQYIGQQGARLDAKMLDAIDTEVRRALEDESCCALAVINSSNSSDNEDNTAPTFLPALETDSQQLLPALRARMQLEIDLRRLNAAKPVVMLVDGQVHASALSLLLAAGDTVVTERFVTLLTADGEHFFPWALHGWACQPAVPGVAEYMALRPDLIIRGAEWLGPSLHLGTAFVAHRSFAAASQRILLAASCPPPHTREALRQACLVESAYPGPCRISVWKAEIAQHFAPLQAASGAYGAKQLEEALGAVGEPWAQRLVETLVGTASRAVPLWIAALRAARDVGYSKALALEYNLAAELLGGSSSSSSSGSVDPAQAEALVSRVAAEGAPLPNILGAPASKEESTTAPVDVPPECPFAQMYRKDPERFKHIDFQAISDHHASLA
ncbi:hypothetical protein GGI07_004181 [Coemansia sp. Benny D115]|nr:hypothetical protein GGI07_004181 [Coemansia sp. Benny D115]